MINIKKKIAIILLLISGLSLVGCKGNSSKKEDSRDKRFIVLYKEEFNSNSFENNEIIRVKDKVTGEEFMIYDGYRKCGITKVDKSNK